MAVLTDYDEAILVEILARLPVKSLMRFQCVCQSWRALISESHFVTKHTSYIDRGITETSSRVIFSLGPAQSIAYGLKEDDDDRLAVRDLNSPVVKLNFLDTWLNRIVGSCNGLICVEYNYKDNILWNPCTGDVRVLPKPPPVPISLSNFRGFGYDSVNDDYKVIRGFNSYPNDTLESAETIFQVFTLKQGSWRTIENLNYVSFHEEAVLLNGALHWLHNPHEGASSILSFDLGTEKFKLIPLPSCAQFPKLLIHRNCLCLYLRSSNSNDIGIWIMKEYGVWESWTQFTYIFFDIFAQENHKDFECRLELLCLLENGEVLIEKEIYYGVKTVILYNPKQNTFKNVLNVGRPGKSMFGRAIYKETLVSSVTGSAKVISNQHCEDFNSLTL